ncbi:hypothetical protein [Candidatus Ichthyocystis sparus]|uniref:hypothetical protein n=1 Tax=Candidatus Ichthyocystis sparus TaxID=1561004 RepID=UPI0011463A9C|nr:hypothetical protein [Candidatus Ichthyocystis sparus]
MNHNLYDSFRNLTVCAQIHVCHSTRVDLRLIHTILLQLHHFHWQTRVLVDITQCTMTTFMALVVLYTASSSSPSSSS